MSPITPFPGARGSHWQSAWPRDVGQLGEHVSNYVKVMPHDYKRVLMESAAQEAEAA